LPAVNVALMITLAYVWWNPYTNGLAQIPTLCVCGLGHVGTTSARVMIRCPTAAKARMLLWPRGATGAELTAQAHLVVSEWADLASAVGNSAVLTASALAPGTLYEFTVEFEHHGDAVTPAINGNLRTQPEIDSFEARSFASRLAAVCCATR
jgi:hypothetical protein